MDTNSRASQADLCSSPKRNAAADSSSKEKKILQGRRQQRHSTEIGSEYHRWWVVRNALGFETNEHIAGLLLDGFHGLLQHLVVMCGGETYHSSLHAELKLSAVSNDCCEDTAQSPSSSSSASPPGGIENMNEFMEYRNAISHYCDSLWRMCCQQGSQLQQLDKTSQPVQEFLIRLMGYLRAAKGKSFSLNPKKKRFKSSNTCVQSLAEGNPSHTNIAKLCPLIANHESQATEAATNSDPHVDQGMAGTTTDDHQGSVDKSTYSATTKLKQAGESPDKSNKIVEECAEQVAQEKCLYDDQSACSYFPVQHQSDKKEQKDLQPKKSQSCYIHLQTGVSRENEVQETQVNHQPLEPSPQQQQEAMVAQPLNLSAHCPHSVPSKQQHQQQQQQHTLQGPQQYALQGPQPAQQILKTDLHNSTVLPNIQTSNQSCFQPKDPAMKEDDQHTQRSVSQEKNSGSETCNLTERRKLGHWWNSDSLNLGSSFRREASLAGAARDSAFNVCGNMSDAAGASDKSGGEFGFLLTDALKILPCIDDDISDLPAPLCPEKENYYIKRQVIQSDFKINSRLDLTSVKQVQGYQANSLMTLCPEQPATSVVSTGRVQSLLANTQVSLQKVKETQTVATNANLYNEVRLNVTNSRHVNEVKSRVHVGNTAFQPLQPAVSSGGEKSASVSLGKPVILYPASTFPSNDSSLASLSSLVHNIVYNSYGTTIKPLSLTPLSSGSVPCSPSPLPPLSMATLENSSQKRSIAAALPVLSSQLSSARSAILPFYISNTADGILPKTTNPAGFSRSSSLPWTHSMTVPETTNTPLSFASIYAQSQSATVPTHLLQPAVPGFTSENRQHTNNMPNAQVKISGVHSCSNPEFSDIGQFRNKTAQSQALAFSLAKVEEVDKKIKSDLSEQHLLNTSVVDKEGHADKQHDLYTRLSSNSSTQLTLVTSSRRSNIEESVVSCNTKETPASPVRCSENASAATPRTIEAGNAQEASVAMLPGKILNSLLANTHLSRSGKNCIGGQGTNIVNGDASVVGFKTEDLADSGSYNTADDASAPNEDNQHQERSIKNTSKKKRRVKDTASTSRSKSPAVTSSHKPSQRRQLMCPVCGVVFFSCVDLLVHRLEQHGHVCGECDSRFLTLSRLKQHKDTEHPLMLICSQCQFHTFQRSDLLEHVWSVHEGSVKEAYSNKDETHNCNAVDRSVIDASCNPANFVEVQQKLNEDSSMKVLEPAADAFSDKQRHNCSKKDSLVKRREPSEDSQVFVNAKENGNTRELSLQESGLLEDVEPVSFGPVFPSFSREVSDPVRPDLGTMSAMFAQVSQHCQLDSSDFLNVSDNPFSESEEPRLVIDTEVCCSKDAGRNGREQPKEKPSDRSEKARHASFVRRPRCNDKPCNRGFRKRKASQLTGKARCNSLPDKEEASVNSVKKNTPSKLCDVYMNKERQTRDTTDGKGKERDRLIMSISLKRQNSTPVYESHACRRRKRRSSKNIVDSRTDTIGVGGSNSESSCSSKSFIRANNTNFYGVPQSSGDQISPNPDHLDKHTRQAISLDDVPAIDSALLCRKNTTTSCQPEEHSGLYQNYLVKDFIDGPSHVNFKSNVLGDIVNNDCSNSHSERSLSLRERHIMTSLPPKKRKLKKSFRARDVSSTVKSQTDFESGVSNGINTHDSDIDVLEQISFIRPDVRVSDQADTMDQIKIHDAIEGSKEKNCCNSDNHETWMTVRPADNLSNVESNSEESGPLCAEHDQQLKISGGSFMGSRKGQLFPRWSMKEHIGRAQGKLSEINCSVSGCEVKCMNKRDLRQHITIEHLGKTRKYMCSWPDCSKGFFARTHLSIHMLTHTGEKPVACDICDYRCRQRTALIWHLRKHGVFHKTMKVKNRRNSTTF